MSYGDLTPELHDELARFEASERMRLGLATPAVAHWTDSMVQPKFTAKQRIHTTVLLGGLTMAHDYLVEGALRGRGFLCRSLACADNESLRVGREFGNLGQCNPTHFTVGNLIKELCRLRDEEGQSTAFILEHYVFFTAGACGPCRFGMYVTEYRKALRDAGFEGFRVMLFQQTGGIEQADGEELGLPLDPPFFLAIARALIAGDVLNASAYRLRPYELEPGATDRALESAKREVYAALAQQSSVVLALRRARKYFRAVRVDRAQAKAKVSILGEFWAMTTEGDGNYHLSQFIEREGGENDVQLLVYLLLYNLWEVRHDTTQRLELKDSDTGKLGLRDVDVPTRLLGVWAGELAVHAFFRTFAYAVGLARFPLPNMDEIARVAERHYNPELRGGEGHLEVAKAILNVTRAKSHMTLSVKPFGCMPSSGVSDGVQSRVTELYPETILCSVETSGEAEVNFHSRVQLFLFKAKQRSQQEFEAALREYGITREQAQAFLANTRYGDPLYRPPHRACGSGADLIHEIGPLMGRSTFGRRRIEAERLARRTYAGALGTVRGTLAGLRRAAPYLPALGRKLLLK
ncbi:MAG: hypothetical protein RL701_2177 [Pseudomonadota bacterium]|jgi:predicted nucleotide-binding protein (sugar kinase/HSP70/actin superfamily)